MPVSPAITRVQTEESLDLLTSKPSQDANFKFQGGVYIKRKGWTVRKERISMPSLASYTCMHTYSDTYTHMNVKIN